jgi:hypothetical protein
MAIMLSMYYLDYIKIDRKLINYIFIINFIISLWFVYLSLSEYAYKGHPTYLTLGYSNPNQTAMFLLFNIITLIAANNFYKNKIIKTLIFIITIYLSYLIYLTDSRICFIVLIIIFVFNFRKKKFKIPKLAVFIITLTPILFMIVYTKLFTSNILLNFEFLGKAFYSGREHILLDVLEDIKNNMILGKLGLYQFENVHNGVLSIIVSLGLLGLILYYLYMLRVLFRVAQKLNNKTAYIAFCGILMVFVQSSAESALMVSGSVYAAAVSILYLLTRVEISNNTIQTKDEMRE